MRGEEWGVRREEGGERSENSESLDLREVETTAQCRIDIVDTLAALGITLKRVWSSPLVCKSILTPLSSLLSPHSSLHKK